MIELPDDELDKLFRKSSEELDPQFDPEDWNNLKKRLDENDGRTPAAWFRKWWPLGLLLMMIPAGIASYYLFGKNGKNDVKQPIGAVSEKNAPKLQTEAVENNNDSAGKPATETGSVSGLKGSEPSVPAESQIDLLNTEKDSRVAESSSKSDLKTALKPSKKPLPRSLSKAGGVYLEPNRSKSDGGDGALSFDVTEKVRKNDPNGTNASELGARQAIGSNGVTPDRAVSGVYKNLSTKPTAESKAEPVATELQTENKTVEDELGRMQFAANNLANQPLSWDNAIPYPAVVAESLKVVSEDANADKVKDEIIESPKWAIRLGYSPDLTTVGFQNFTKPGTAFSLLGEYGLTKRLYVQTGVVRTEKDYYAPGSEYKFKYYVTSINTPDSLDGVCLMYEIPLGIRYDFVQKAHSRLFAGTGFSSYYIQKEEYTYYYKTYKHGQKPYWEGKSGLTLFSHLNASVGYEHTITRKLSILAEPYIRIPLKGVGYGKVNLTTIGMWLSLRYTPAFR